MSSVLDLTATIRQDRSATAVDAVDLAFYPGERVDVQQCARRLFGRPLRLAEYVQLTGATGRARVELGTLDGGLYLETRWRGYRAVERVRPDAAGPVLVIDAMHIRPARRRRRGLGLSLVRRKLDCAARLGVRRVETRAGREPGENGYYTWPRFGFDGPLPREIRRRLPPEFQDARAILDLVEFDTGRRWWAEHGTAVDVVFDLAKRSRSWRALNRYVRQKRSPLPRAGAGGGTAAG